MRYYRLCYDFNKASKKHYVCCNQTNMNGMDEHCLIYGNVLKDIWNTPTFYYNPDEFSVWSDYLFNTFHWPIVSDIFVQKTSDFLKKSIEVLNVNIINIQTNDINCTYKAINIVNIIDAIDYENSLYSKVLLDEEEILLVRKHVLQKKVVDGYDIFRLKNDAIPIFISEKLKKVIENNKLTGFDFCEVSVI